MNQGLENYLLKVSELEERFPGMSTGPYESGITPHEFVAEVEYPALECNKVIFNTNDTYSMWWVYLVYRDSYEGNNKRIITVTLLKIIGKDYEWDYYRQEILKHIELLSENENLPEVEAELALATFRVYDARYSQ